MLAQPDPQLSTVAQVVRDRRSRPRASQGAVLVAIDGSVSVGKSTTAGHLAQLLEMPPDALAVTTVSTDGFLFPNRVLDERGLTMRKGYPESYDHDALDAFVTSVRTGSRELSAPVYSHETYDVVAEPLVFAAPDVLVLEGLHTMRLAQRVDLSVYVDAADDDIERWYTERFFDLRASRSGFYAQFATMSDAAATEFAHTVWDEINAPNLHENILPTRDRADVVIRKGPDHAVVGVTLRE